MDHVSGELYPWVGALLGRILEGDFRTDEGLAEDVVRVSGRSGAVDGAGDAVGRGRVLEQVGVQGAHAPVGNKMQRDFVCLHTQGV